MNKIFVIGNGFDLYHGLKTSYKDFKDYVKDTNYKLFELIERYYLYRKDDFWYDFESNLAYLDDGAIRDYASNYLEPYGCENWRDAYHHDYQYEINNIIDSVVNGLDISFKEWIKHISIEGIQQGKIELDLNSFFLSFNYTQTLEQIYNIPLKQILYIHGKYTGMEDDNLIYGHGGKAYDINMEHEDPRVTEGEEIIQEYFEKTTKPVNKIIHKNKSFFDSLSPETKCLIVIGHSMNEIDAPYFKEISKHVNRNADWNYYFYSTEDIVTCLNLLHGELNIPYKHIRFLSYPV